MIIRLKFLELRQLINKAYKLRIYPNKEQEILLNK